MSLYNRAFNQMLRHDPFSPLFSRSAAFSPFSLWDSFFNRQPIQTFFQLEEQPRQQRTQRNQQNTNTTTSDNSTNNSENKESNGNGSSSTVSGSSRQLSRRYEDDHYLTHRHRPRHHRHDGHQRHHHPLSLFSPWSVFSASQLPEMTVDFFTSPEAYTIHAAVPGINKNDIKITVEEGMLNIQAERKHERKEKRRDTNQTNSSSAEQKEATATSTEQKETEKKEAAEPTTPVESSSTSAPSASSSAAASDATSEAKQSAESEDDLDQYDYIESSYGRVERSFPLPDDVDVNQLSAKYEDGVIKINIPRVAQKKQEAKRIDIQ